MKLLKGERYTVSPMMDGYPPIDSAVPFDRAEAEREHVIEDAETESPGVNRGLPRDPSLAGALPAVGRR